MCVYDVRRYTGAPAADHHHTRVHRVEYRPSLHAVFLSIEEKLPFRTITGRQSYYLDHELMAEWGEGLATYKPILDYKPLKKPHDAAGYSEITLKYLTPHNKWSTHSMYFDSQQLLTLFRGGQSVWMNEEDAAAIGVEDND